MFQVNPAWTVGSVPWMVAYAEGQAGGYEYPPYFW